MRFELGGGRFGLNLFEGGRGGTIFEIGTASVHGYARFELPSL